MKTRLLRAAILAALGLLVAGGAEAGRRLGERLIPSPAAGAGRLFDGPAELLRAAAADR
jgi:hypothetical protein